jgi:hypothetical protein
VRAPRRVVFLIGLVAFAVGLVSWSRSRTPVAVETPRLTYVTTAHQLGVVGYRDPIGAVSRDGRYVALTEGRRLFETLISGGARVEIAAANGQIRHVAAGPDGSWIFEDAAAPKRWWVASSRSPMRALFDARTELEATVAGESAPIRRRLDDLRQLVASLTVSGLLPSPTPHRALNSGALRPTDRAPKSNG